MDKLILITNDDGVHANGIFELKNALAELGQIVVVAPDQGRSACGHGITLHKPLRAHKVRLRDGSPAYSTTGLPTDCIHIGMMSICDRRPDLVVSGINLGANLGWELTYSGTVAGAMEGAAFGIPAFSISVTTYEDGDVYKPAGRFANFIAREILERGLPDGTFLNVNVPLSENGHFEGVELTRVGKRQYPGRVETRKDPMGREYHWLGGDVPVDDMEDGTDVKAIHEGRISVTPVHLDLTAYSSIPAIEPWPLNSFSMTSIPG